MDEVARRMKASRVDNPPLNTAGPVLHSVPATRLFLGIEITVKKSPINTNKKTLKQGVSLIKEVTASFLPQQEIMIL